MKKLIKLAAIMLVALTTLSSIASAENWVSAKVKEGLHWSMAVSLLYKNWPNSSKAIDKALENMRIYIEDERHAREDGETMIWLKDGTYIHWESSKATHATITFKNGREITVPIAK